MQIQINKEIPLSRIADLLCGAFDPASNAVGYWCEIVGQTKPPVMKFQTDPKQIYPYMDYPLNVGGELIIKEQEPENGKQADNLFLNLFTIKSGLETMAEKYPKHFADFLEENDDNDTADVFVQCALLGDVIYG